MSKRLTMIFFASYATWTIEFCHRSSFFDFRWPRPSFRDSLGDKSMKILKIGTNNSTFRISRSLKFALPIIQFPPYEFLVARANPTLLQLQLPQPKTHSVRNYRSAPDGPNLTKQSPSFNFISTIVRHVANKIHYSKFHSIPRLSLLYIPVVAITRCIYQILYINCECESSATITHRIVNHFPRTFLSKMIEK